VLEEKFLTFALMGVEWVLWLLVLLSVLCLAIAIERAVFGALNRTPKTVLEPALGTFMNTGDTAELRKRLADATGVEARVIQSGLNALEHGGSDAADAAMAGTLAHERLRMDRGLIVLGTVGANAPFIGLFGTVLGIIQAFHELSLADAEAAQGVMSGISDALVATAIGLLVAIPAVVLYNFFQRRNKRVVGRIESLGQLMISRVTGTQTEAMS